MPDLKNDPAAFAKILGWDKAAPGHDRTVFFVSGVRQPGVTIQCAIERFQRAIVAAEKANEETRRAKKWLRGRGWSKKQIAELRRQACRD